MTDPILFRRASSLAIMAACAALAAGCHKSAPAAVAQAPMPIATLPLSDAPAGPAVDAPPVSALPPYRVPIERVANPDEEYAFADRADEAAYGFGDAPPDYGFDYGDEQPWVWQGDNGYETVVEPLAGGGDRYYFYQPGADTPYYVRDPDYGYGYEAGALVVVYDRYGHPLPMQEQERQWDSGGRYMGRARALWRASRGAHVEISRASWNDRRQAIGGDESQWLQARQQNPDWRAYHDQHAAQDQAIWNQERYRRESEAYRIDQASNNAPRAQHERDAAMAVVAGGAVVGAAALSSHHALPPQPAATMTPTGRGFGHQAQEAANPPRLGGQQALRAERQTSTNPQGPAIASIQARQAAEQRRGAMAQQAHQAQLRQADVQTRQAQAQQAAEQHRGAMAQQAQAHQAQVRQADIQARQAQAQQAAEQHRGAMAQQAQARQAQIRQADVQARQAQAQQAAEQHRGAMAQQAQARQAQVRQADVQARQAQAQQAAEQHRGAVAQQAQVQQAQARQAQAQAQQAHAQAQQARAQAQQAHAQAQQAQARAKPAGGGNPAADSARKKGPDHPTQ